MTKGTDSWRDLGDTDLAHFTKSVQRSYQTSGVSPMSKEAAPEFAALSAVHLTRFAAAVAYHETMDGTWPGPIPYNYKNPFAVVYGVTTIFMPGMYQVPSDYPYVRSIAPTTHTFPPSLVVTAHDLPMGHTWAQYATYLDAVKAWIAIITNPRGAFAKTTSIAEFVHVYAPGSDGNDEASYVSTLCLILDRDVPLVTPVPVPPPGPTPPPVPPAPDVGRRIADCAVSELGKPYVWGTHGPDTFDCSGLVAYCAAKGAQISVSPDSHAQYQAGVSIERAALRAGDILCYDTEGGTEVRIGNRCSHVGIYLSPGVMVNALNPSVGVIKSDPFDAYFAPLYLGARRLQPSPAPTPVPLPPIYRQVVTANHQPRPLGASMIQFLVHHITDDMNYANVQSWFQNPASRASSTFVIDRDGKIYQFMSTLVAPWTNGEVNRPTRLIPALTQAIAQPYNLNEFCVTIEYVGTPTQPPTEAQYLSGIAIARYVVGTYHVPPHRFGQLRHADIDSVNRPYCPGPHFDLARIITAIGGNPGRIS